MGDDYECLNQLSLDLEKETKAQKELVISIKAKLSLPYPQTKEIEKLFTANQRCFMEFHRILKKLKVPAFLVLALYYNFNCTFQCI